MHQRSFKHNATPPSPNTEYETQGDELAGLRGRPAAARQLDVWVTPEALAAWQAPRRKTRSGQSRYSDLAIETVLTLDFVFGLRLRQSEGLMLSLLELMGLDLPFPDQTTLSRRART